MADLFALVVEAQALAGAHPCKVLGHQWMSVGGRACPYGKDDGALVTLCPDGEVRSQTVYQCRRCGVHDYGEIGGPGHEECMDFCGVRADQTNNGASDGQRDHRADKDG